jgi:hypothetical protein
MQPNFTKLIYRYFGCIVVRFNQGDGCLFKVLTQNLRAVSDRSIESPISCAVPSYAVTAMSTSLPGPPVGG